MATPNVPNLIYPLADLEILNVLPYTENADGSWTAVSTGLWSSGAASFLGYIDSFMFNLDQNLIDAMSADSGYANRLATYLDGSFTVFENTRRGTSASTGSIIDKIINAGPNGKVSWAYTKVAADNPVATMYGKWRRITLPGAQGQGKQLSGLVLDMVDTSYTTIAGVVGIAPFSITYA
jgi:hypothetical protein